MPYYLFKRLKTVNMTVLSRLIYRFNAMTIKITARYFMEIYKMIVTCFEIISGRGCIYGSMYRKLCRTL